jgi:hypothetical protein
MRLVCAFFLHAGVRIFCVCATSKLQKCKFDCSLESGSSRHYCQVVYLVQDVKALINVKIHSAAEVAVFSIRRFVQILNIATEILCKFIMSRCHHRVPGESIVNI